MPANGNCLALPLGWRNVLVSSEDALRWLGRSNLIAISNELNAEIKCSRTTEQMYAKMYKRYGDEYYRRRLARYRGMPEAFEQTKALVLKSLVSASDKPILGEHRPVDYFDKSKYVYVWFEQGTLDSIKQCGFRRVRVDTVHSDEGYLVVVPPKNDYTQYLCIATCRSALLSEEDIHYLCHDLNYAQFYLSFSVSDDSLYKEIFASLMRFRGRFPLPPDYLVESPVMPTDLGMVIRPEVGKMGLDRCSRRRNQ